jgi:hypothetical protein
MGQALQHTDEILDVGACKLPQVGGELVWRGFFRRETG